MATYRELPYVIRRLHVRCRNSSSKYIKYKEFDIYVSEHTNVHHLREYLSRVKLVEGLYYFKEDCIDRFEYINVQNGDTLEIKEYRERQGNLLNVSLKLSLNEKEDEKYISVPTELTFRLLKFIIQSEVLIKVENQYFRRYHRKWEVEDSYALRVPDDFENFIVEDSSYFKNDYRSFSAISESYTEDIGMGTCITYYYRG